MAGTNWQRIDKAPKGIGDALLRVAGGPLDGVAVGKQYDDGRWYVDGTELRPAFFCAIPPFDFDEGAQQ